VQNTGSSCHGQSHAIVCFSAGGQVLLLSGWAWRERKSIGCEGEQCRILEVRVTGSRMPLSASQRVDKSHISVCGRAVRGKVLDVKQTTTSISCRVHCSYLRVRASYTSQKCNTRRELFSISGRMKAARDRMGSWDGMDFAEALAITYW
jgi:hypothetical protein